MDFPQRPEEVSFMQRWRLSCVIIAEIGGPDRESQ